MYEEDLLNEYDYTLAEVFLREVSYYNFYDNSALVC